MPQGNNFKFQRGAAANTEFEDRKNSGENRQHARDGTVGPQESPVFLNLWRFEQGQGGWRELSRLSIPFSIARPREAFYDADQQCSRLPVNSSRTDCTDFARLDWSCSCIVRAQVADCSEIELEKTQIIARNSMVGAVGI